jgi:hypothetical protein
VEKEPANNKIAIYERGIVYLRRFKNLSKAFETGEFKASPNYDQETPDTSAAWSNVRLDGNAGTNISKAK